VPYYAGQKLKASDLGQETTTAEYNAASNQSIPNNADTTIAFGTTNLTSTLVTRSTSGAGHKFTLGRSGLWVVSASIRFTAAATGERAMNLATAAGRFANSSHPGSSGSASNLFIEIVKYFASGTEIHIGVFQNSGGALNSEGLNSDAYGRFNIGWLGG
jgi:hypothetical protein